MPFEYEYPRPAVSVDIVATREKSGGRELLLIQRKNEPHKNSWASVSYTHLTLPTICSVYI